MPPTEITVSPVASTKMGGPEDVLAQERRFFDGLQAARGISYTESEIALTWDEGQSSIVLRRC